MATLIAGCVSSQEAAKKDPINLVMNLWPGYSHPFIAAERKLFEDDELVVNISLEQEYSENVKRFVQGEFDGIFEVYSDAMLQYAQGIPIKVVYVPDFSSGGDVLVGRPEIKSIADLKGKSISVEEFNGFSHIFVLDLLRRNGLTESDVTIIEVPAHGVLNALEANRIDAGHTWEPTKSDAIGRGYRLLATSEETPGIITDVLVIRSELAEKRPDDIRTMVAGFIKAIEFLDIDQTAAFSIMSEATGLSPGSLKEGIDGVRLLDAEGNKKAFTRSQDTSSLFKSGEFISELFLEHGVIDEPVNIDALLAPGIVNELK